MSHVTRRVGSVEVTAVLDCDFPNGPIVESFPDIPAADLLAARATGAGVYTDDDQWRLRVRVFLLRSAGGPLLFDTGLGGAASPTQAWAPVQGEVANELAAMGVERHDIETVAISHVHDDHIGGVLDDKGEPMFPNARYIVQRADHDWLRETADQNEEAAAGWALIRPLADLGVLDLIDGDLPIDGALALRHLPGHTPGHQILRIDDGDSRMVLSADTWNHPAQFAHPEWPSGPDNDHAESATARRLLLAELLSEPGTIIGPTHLDTAFGEVTTAPDGSASFAPIG